MQLYNLCHIILYHCRDLRGQKCSLLHKVHFILISMNGIDGIFIFNNENDVMIDILITLFHTYKHSIIETLIVYHVEQNNFSMIQSFSAGIIIIIITNFLGSNSYYYVN